MKKMLPWLVTVLILITAYFTKPNDKTCIIRAEEVVWGKRVPDKKDKPALYEEFMNLTSQQVIVDDLIFLKRIRYRFPKKEYNIGIAAFNHIITHD